ncbi:MAG: hypothetical protein ACP5GR_06175, partial [Thermoplasmata archaeon]
MDAIYSSPNFSSNILSFFPVSNLKREYVRNGTGIRRMGHVIKIKAGIVSYSSLKLRSLLLVSWSTRERSFIEP